MALAKRIAKPRASTSEDKLKAVDSSDYVRIQFEVSTSSLDKIDRLARDTKTRTRKDLINEALTLLQWAVKERKSGRVIASIDENKKAYMQFTMPALERIDTDEL